MRKLTDLTDSFFQQYNMWNCVITALLAVVLFMYPTLIVCNGNADGSRSIYRSEIIQRAQFWSNQSVPYSQTKHAPGPDGIKYRTDCSGFVSMAWKLNTSLNTRTFLNVVTSISKSDLRSGDILLYPGSHVLIFDKWALGSRNQTKYWAYEMAGGKIDKCVYHQIKNYPYWNRSGYSPYRYLLVDPSKEILPDKNRTGPCRCPPYSDLASLKHYNSLAPTYCGHQDQMLGSCPSKNLYYCYYNYKLDPSGQGTTTVLETCEYGCQIGKYRVPECAATGFDGIGEMAEAGHLKAIPARNTEEDSTDHNHHHHYNHNPQQDQPCDNQDTLDSESNLQTPVGTSCVNNCQECRLACNSNAVCVGNDTWLESCSCMPDRIPLTPCGGDASAFCRKVCQQCPDFDHCPQADMFGCLPCKTLPPGEAFKSMSSMLPMPKFIAIWLLGGIIGLICGHVH